MFTRRVSGVRVGRSVIAGRGVFATRSFRPAKRSCCWTTRASWTTSIRWTRRRVSWRTTATIWRRPGGTDALARLLHQLELRAEYLGGDPRWCPSRRGAHCVDAGDEVTYDYLINCHGGVVWQCRCGTRRCRGTIPASFFDLPAGEQRRLRGLLDGWFVAEHADRLRALDQEVGS